MDPDQRAAVAARVRALRERGDYSQPAVATAVGVSLRAYQKWESSGGITYANALALAGFHGVSVDYLLNGDEAGDGEKVDPVDRIDRTLRAVLTELQGIKTRLADIEQDARDRALEDLRHGQAAAAERSGPRPGTSPRGRGARDDREG